MSEDVISLTSSDEDNSEPPPKRKKIAPPPHVTLTLLPNSKKKGEPIETVTLDSDDDLDHCGNQSNSVSDNSKNSLCSTEKVDLITLTDDEEDISHSNSNDVNSVNAIINSIFSSDTVELVSPTKDTDSLIPQDKRETVSIIDSDSETETSVENHVQPIEEICKNPTKSNEADIKEPNEDFTENDVQEILEVTNDNNAVKDSNSKECKDKSNTVSIVDSDSETELNTEELIQSIEEATKDPTNTNKNITNPTIKEGAAVDADEIINAPNVEAESNNSVLQQDKDITLSATESDIIEITNEETKNGNSAAHHDKDITVSITDSDNEPELIAEKHIEAVEETCKEFTDENISTNESISELKKDSPENHISLLDEEVNENIEQNDDNIKETQDKIINKDLGKAENPIEDGKSDEFPEENPCIDDDLLNVYRVEIDENEVTNGSKVEKEDNYETVNADTSSNDIISRPSTSLNNESAVVENKTFKKFLKIVEEKIVGSSFEEILPKKVPIIQKYFKKCGSYVNEIVFEKLLNDCIETVKNAPTSNAANTAVLSFHKIFEHLKSHVTETSIEIEQEHLPKVKKLEKTMKLLVKRIKILEEAEVNFDDEEDSAYIILDRYEVRLNKVYAKYCEYIRRNPFSGRAVYDKISFVHSKYNAINQAISKKYRNSVTFPSYYELEKYIGKISKKEKLDLSDSQITRETKKCFKYLGNILQKKRRQELYDSHLGFIESTEDPATKDLSLENLLKKNFSEGKDKIEKLYQKFVDKQEQGEDHISSDDGATSENSDSEEIGEKESSKNGKKVKKKGKKENGSFTENPVEKENKKHEEQEVNAIKASEKEETETVKKKERHIPDQDKKEITISDTETHENVQNANLKET